MHPAVLLAVRQTSPAVSHHVLVTSVVHVLTGDHWQPQAMSFYLTIGCSEFCPPPKKNWYLCISNLQIQAEILWDRMHFNCLLCSSCQILSAVASKTQHIQDRDKSFPNQVKSWTGCSHEWSTNEPWPMSSLSWCHFRSDPVIQGTLDRHVMFCFYRLKLSRNHRNRY